MLDTGDCHLILDAGRRPRRKTVGVTVFKSVGFTGVRVDQSAPQAAVLIAGELQDQLAGGMPFVQWPIDGQRLLTPTFRDGHAVWIARSSDRVIAEIGYLCSS
ncbi:Uncharacterised protein [Rhodococcus gordoniae]|uniref:Uncharacterized protein n=1 Tax=Rhodococcus gordoniae TaxID=223392 RepID=A0A379PSW2_9NOCA|nr:Uncharacterised protein [Rhodococcus gordoniae]